MQGPSPKTVLWLLAFGLGLSVPAFAENQQCMATFSTDSPQNHANDKIALIKDGFALGSKTFAVADNLARDILNHDESEQRSWLAQIGNVYRQIPKQDPNPTAAWTIGGRRLLDRVITRLERCDLKFAAAKNKGLKTWDIYQNYLSDHQQGFHINYSADEIAVIIQAIQSQLVAKQEPNRAPLTILLAGSFINGKASLTHSDLDISVSDPLLLRDLPELQDKVDSLLRRIRPDANLKFEAHTEPAAFYGQLNAIVIKVSAQKVELLVYGPAVVGQDGRSLRAADFSAYEVEQR